jgi:hypothetical protein
MISPRWCACSKVTCINTSLKARSPSIHGAVIFFPWERFRASKKRSEQFLVVCEDPAEILGGGHGNGLNYSADKVWSCQSNFLMGGIRVFILHRCTVPLSEVIFINRSIPSFSIGRILKVKVWEG